MFLLGGNIKNYYWLLKIFYTGAWFIARTGLLLSALLKQNRCSFYKPSIATAEMPGCTFSRRPGYWSPLCWSGPSTFASCVNQCAKAEEKSCGESLYLHLSVLINVLFEAPLWPGSNTRLLFALGFAEWIEWHAPSLGLCPHCRGGQQYTQYRERKVKLKIFGIDPTTRCKLCIWSKSKKVCLLWNVSTYWQSGHVSSCSVKRVTDRAILFNYFYWLEGRGGSVEWSVTCCRGNCGGRHMKAS